MSARKNEGRKNAETVRNCAATARDRRGGRYGNVVVADGVGIGYGAETGCAGDVLNRRSGVRDDNRDAAALSVAVGDVNHNITGAGGDLEITGLSNGAIEKSTVSLASVPLLLSRWPVSFVKSRQGKEGFVCVMIVLVTLAVTLNLNVVAVR